MSRFSFCAESGDVQTQYLAVCEIARHLRASEGGTAKAERPRRMQKESKRAVKGTEKPVLMASERAISHYVGPIYLYMIETDTYIIYQIFNIF